MVANKKTHPSEWGYDYLTLLLGGMLSIDKRNSFSPLLGDNSFYSPLMGDITRICPTMRQNLKFYPTDRGCVAKFMAKCYTL